MVPSLVYEQHGRHARRRLVEFVIAGQPATKANDRDLIAVIRIDESVVRDLIRDNIPSVADQLILSAIRRTNGELRDSDVLRAMC